MDGDRRASAPLFWLGAAAAAGIVLSVRVAAAPLVPLLLAVAAAGGALWFRGRTGKASLLLFSLAVFWLYGIWQIRLVPAGDLRRWMGGDPGAVELRFEITEDPGTRRSDDGRERREFDAACLAIRTEGEWKPATGGIRVRWRGPEGTGAAYGQVREARGFLAPPPRPENPGEFDYAAWLEGRGIFYLFDVADARPRPVGNRGWWIKAQAVRLKHHMLRVLSLGLENDPGTTALMAGMLFGYREGIREPLMEAFRVTGTLHVFAVSGQNVAVILGMLLILLQLAGLLPWRWGWLLLPVLLVFCLSTGMQPSAFRAWLMAGIVLVGWVFCRRVDVFNLLGGAALLMWLWDPRCLFDLGFQLSFLVVLGLAVLTPPLYRCWAAWGEADPWIPRRRVPRWRHQFHRCWKGLCGLLAASCAAWLASLPLVWKEFHLVAPVTVLANLCVVPLAGLVVVVAAVSVAVGAVWSGFSVVVNQVNWLLLKLVVACVLWLSELPGAYFYAGFPWEAPEAGETRVTLMAGRHQVAGLVETPGRAWLLDPGTESLWKYTIDPWRRERGINTWDGVVFSGSGSRQLGAAPLLFGRMGAGWIAESGWTGRSPAQAEWREWAAAAGRGRRFWREGDRPRWSPDIRVRVLWPDPLRGEAEAHPRLEDRGLVLLLESRGVRLLWAGSISDRVERELLAGGRPLRADILVQGEHSTGGNLRRDWLEAVGPRWLVRPRRGYFPDRGLTPAFWKAARELDVRVLRMDETGAVTFHLREGGVRVETFRPLEAGD